MNIYGIKISEKIYMPVIILLVSLIIYTIISSIIDRRINVDSKLPKHLQRSRKTVLLLIKGIVKVFIIVIDILAILQVFGVNTSALIAGVSAVTVVIGLAFQDVLKDLLVGAAIILESQYALGETVSINGFKGEVISLNLRSTRLKALTGEVKIIANRNISEVINYSLDNILLKINVNVSYEDDLDKVEKVINNVIIKLNKEISELKSDIELKGIETLTASSVEYLLTAKVSDKDQYVTRRIITKEIKLAFDKNNIKIPYTQIEVHHEK